MADEKIAHLGFIQGVINRMSNNSFLVKGWTVALVAAIFALAAKDTNQHFIYIALLPIIAFWLLDSYYLQQEILFRKLYDKVAKNSVKSNEFIMDTKSLNKEVKSIPRLFFTVSIFPFYFLVTILLLVVAVISGIDFSLISKLCQR